MQLTRRLTVVSVFLCIFFSACGSAPDCPGDCAADELGGVQQVQGTACRVDLDCGGEDPVEPPPGEVRMPTDASVGMTPSQVRSRLSGDGYSGEGFSQETLTNNRRRWTYWSVRCADGASWCLSRTGSGTPYSITFQNEVLSSTAVWQRLSIKFWNASGRWCRLTAAYPYEGAVTPGTLFDGVIPFVEPAEYDRYSTAGAWIWPGVTLTMQAYCHAPGYPAVEYAEANRTVEMTVPFTWNLTSNVSGGTATLE